jgi:hypothetical protein
MRTRRSILFILSLLALALLAGPFGTRAAQAQEADPPISTGEIEIVGIEPRPQPATQVAPRNTGTIVTPLLVRSDGVLNGELPELPEDAIFLAELRGPAFGTPVALSARPNEPFIIPALPLEGRYTVTNIRLVSGGKTLLQAKPDTATIQVIEKVLVSQVTSRPLTAEEIREKGIVVDQTNFQVINFTVAFGLDNERIEVQFPMIIPTNFASELPGVPTINFPHMSPAAPPDSILPGLETLVNIPNMEVTGFGLDIPEDDDRPRGLLSPIPGVVIIPGNVAYLNQFFSVILKVSNVAPGYSNLVVKNLQTEIILPGGNDTVPNTGDDPLRMARLGDPPSPQSRTQPVVQAGPDGKLGTSDDILTLGPNQSGDAEFLVEGLKEGTHRIEMKITGILEGLPGGPVPLQGRAVGIVEVRNPTFALTFNHPAIVTAGEAYDFNVTVTNVSDRPANFASLSLLPRSLSGVELVSDQVMPVESIPPGDSATVTFKMKSLTTGAVTSSSYASDGIPGRFELRMGVGELGIPMSPNVLVLPPAADSLKTRTPELYRVGIGLLGQAHALGSAPTTPRGLLPMRTSIVYEQASNVAAAGQRVSLGEPLADMARDLALDFMGNNYTRLPERYNAQQQQALLRAEQDYRGFDSLMRQSSRGADFLGQLSNLWDDAIESQGVLAFQGDFAEAAASRPSHLSAIVGDDDGSAPVVLNLTDLNGKRLGIRAVGGAPVQEVPFGAFFSLIDEDPEFSQMAMVAVPITGTHTVEVLGTDDGSFDLGIVVPEGNNSLRHVQWSDVPVRAGVRGRVTFNVNSATNSYVLMIDTDNDGDEDPVQPSSAELVVDRGPSVIGSVQIYSERKGETGTKYGQVMGVLFDEEISLESSQDLRLNLPEITNYSVDGNAVQGAALQPGGRVVLLGLRDGIGPFIDRSLTVRNVEDRLGHVMEAMAQPRPIEPAANLPSGGTLQGTVRRADGTPVPLARIVLKMVEMDINDDRYLVVITSKNADSEGRYSFDWIREQDAVIEFMDLQTGEGGIAYPRIRHNGHRLEMDLILIGTGTVTGQVFAEDGKTPLAGADIVVANPLKGDEAYQVKSDANGAYIVTRVPVGNVSIRAAHVASRSQTVLAATIPTAGATIVQNLILHPVSDDYPRGNVQGQVFRSDGVTPAVGVPVYSAIGGVDTTNEAGRYVIEGLPTGPVTVRAIDQSTFEVGDASTTISANITTTANIIMHGGTGTVEGVVVENDVPLEGITIYGGRAVVKTGADGTFVLNDVPVGVVRLQARDERNPNNIRMIEASANLTHDGETVEVRMEMPLQGILTGVVRDAAGNTVPNLKVYAYGADGYNNKTFTNAQGQYRFENVPLSKYTIAAFFPDFSDGNFREGQLVFKDQTLRLDVNFRGRGNVIGTVYDDDTVTPLGARVGLSEWIVKIGRLIPRENPECLPDVYVGEEKVLDLPECENVPVEWKYQNRSRRINSNVETGTFTFTNVFLGNFMVEAANPFSPQEVSVEGEILTPTQTVSTTLILQSTGIVTGTVYQPDGVTPVGAEVVVEMDAAYISNVRVVTNGQGQFEFPLAPPGGFTLTAEDSTGLVGQINGSVQAGQTTNVNVRLLREGSVTVTVTGLNGTGQTVPEEGASVQLAEGNFPYRRFTGTTGPNGTITFAGGNAPVEGFFSVQATKQGVTGRTSGRILGITEDLNGHVSVSIHLDNAVGTVTGRFLRSDGVTPIPNAQVSLSTAGRQAFVTTGPDGAYLFDGVRVLQNGGTTFTLEGFDPATGRRGRESGQLTTPGETVTRDMIQISQGTVTGNVRWASDGSPVRAAEVNLSSSAGGQFRTTTGVNGTFTIPGVSAGNFSVSVRDTNTGLSRNATGTLSSEGETVTVELEIQTPPRGRVEGYVFTASGAPATTVSVRLYNQNYSSSNVTVDDEGFYTIENVPPGTYTVRATAQNSPDTGLGTAEVESAGDVGSADIHLLGLGRVVGVVQTSGANPQPVPFVRVDLVRNDSGSALYFRADDQTASDGTFEFDEVLVGDISLSTVQGSTGLAGSASGVLPGPGETLTLTLTLEDAASVRGRVLRQNGEPAPLMALELQVFTSPPRYRYGSTSNVEPNVGTFRLDNLKLGDYLLRVSDPLGEGIATASFTLNQQGQVVDLGDIVLDTAPPEVVSITPASGAVGVPVGTNIQVRFSEAVDPTTATNTNLSVSNARGVVTGTWALNDEGTIATFTRGAGTFGDLEVVSVRVRTGIKDLVGRNLKAQVVSAFTTTDETPPVTSSVSPAAGATGVPLNSVVRVNYSETIVPAEFDDPARAITVTLNGTALLGTVEPILNNRALVFTPDPSDPLLANSTYEVTIQPATDTYGNRQPEGRTYTFETIDVQAPVVQSLAAAPGTTVRVGATATITAQLQTAPDVAFVEFFVNGVSRHIQQSAPYAFSLPITRDMGSKVTVSARATDLAGNESVAKSLDLVILPNAAPQVSITTPTGGSQVRNGERITVTVQATDDAGLSKLFFQASGAVQATVTRDVPQGTNTSYTTTFFVNVPLNAPPGASIELRASALDTGNATGDAQAVTVLVRDSIAPSVQITAPQNGVKVEPGEMVTVTVRATDNGSVSAISLTGSGAASFSETREITPSQSPAEVTFQVPVSETARVTDTLVLSARATDTTGNTSQQTSITLGIKDIWPPQVSVTLPNGVTNVAPGETIAVTVSGTDDVSVVNVGLELAGVIEGVQTQLITPPRPNGSRVFQVTIPATVTVEANTELRLTGRASDAVGNLGRSQTVTLPVIVDEVPQVSITAPTAGATIRNGRQLTVTVQTSDDGGVKQVALKATGAVSFNQTQNVSPITNTHTATFVINVPTNAPLGTITLEASAVDTRNQRATAPTVAVQVVDQTPPAAQILSPANGGKVNPGATVQVQVRATDSYGVAAIELTTSGAFTLTQTRPVSPTATTTTQTFNVVVPETAAANVPVVFSAKATDGSGNASQVAAITLTVRDVTAPQVTVTLPEGLTSVIQGGTFTVAVTATDNVAITELGLSTTGAFQVAEVEPINPAQSPATAEFTIRVPANAPANQPFTIFGSAKDAEGNLGNDEGGTLVVELPETLVSGRVTNADGAVSGAEVTITATNGVFTDTADAQGDYEIAGIAAGDLEVVAVDPTTGLRAVALGSLEPGDVEAVIDLEIPDAPEVSVTEPISGTTAIEGTNVTVSAIATSTLGVGQLVFTVDGTPVFTDTNETSSFDLVVPEGVESLTLGAVVYDYYDNTSTAEVVVNVVPDSRTTLVGRVVTTSQNGPVPVPGATITTVDDLSTTTGQDGRFSLAGVPTIYGDIQVVIRATFEGKPYQAILIVTPIPGAVTDLQDVEVKLVKFWDGGGNGTSWHDARNWNNDSLPVGSDDVYIPASANVTYSTSFFEINSLTSDGALTLTGGTLSLAKDSVIKGAFTFSNGTLMGAGNLTLEGAATWTRGTMSGSGVTTVAKTLTVNPPNGWGVVLGEDRTLENRGTVNWVGSTGGTSYFYMQQDAVFNNLAEATFEIGLSSKQFVFHNTGSTGELPLFNNQGTFRKVGAGEISLTNTVFFHNAGTIEVAVGALKLADGGNHSGNFAVASGATLEFSGGTHTLTAQSSVSGQGTVVFSNSTSTSTINVAGKYEVGSTRIAGATVNFNSSATSTNTAFSNGTMGGSGTYTAAGPFTWTTGTMEGTGTTIISNTLTLNPTSGNGTILGRTLENRGTVNWTDSTGGTSYFYMRSGAVFNNLAGTTFEVGGSAKHFSHTNGGTGALPLFNNQGTFRKVGSNVIEVNSSFNLVNNGTFDITAGSVEFKHGTTHSGSFLVRSGTTFTFSAGTHTLNEQSSLTGEGTVVFSTSSGTPTINVAGQYQLRNTNIAGGTVNFNSAATSTNTAFSNGTMGGSGTYTAAGPFTWTTGTMEGSGTTIISNTLTLNPTSGNGTILGRTLENRGTVNWTNNTGAGGTSYFYMRSGAVFNNLAGTTFEVGGSAKHFSHTNGGTGALPLFNNQGTLRKAGSNAMVVNLSFNLVNNGTFDITAGSVEFKHGTTHSGSFLVRSGTTFSFTEGTHTLNEQSSLTGEGTVVFGVSSGTPIINVAGQYQVSTTNIAGGKVYFNGAATSTNTTFSSGTMGGSGTYTAAGPFTWTTGTMEGTGTTIISNTLTLNPTNGNGTTLGRTLENRGTVNWTNNTGGTSHFYMQSGAVFNNLAGATFEVGENTKQFSHTNGGAGSAPLFNNLGTLRKIGAGTATMSSSVVFVNSGTVQVQSGTLKIEGMGAHSGTFRGASGSILEFAGGHTLGSSSVISSTGSVNFTGGITSVQGTYDVRGGTSISGGTTTFTGQVTNVGQNLTVSGTSTTVDFSSGETLTPNLLTLDTGTLTGSDNIVATNVHWTRGTLVGSGVTTATQTLTIDTTGGWSTTLGRTFNNAGTATWTNTASAHFYMQNGSVFNNLAGATFEMGDGKRITHTAGGTGAVPFFNNAGTIRKVSTGSTNFNSAVTFLNTGTVEARSGTFELAGNNSHSGTFTATSGGTLEFSGNNTLTSGSVVNGTGTIRFNGGTTNIQGTYDVVGTTTMNGGKANLTGQILGGGSTVNVSGGEINFTGQMVDSIETLSLTSGTANFSTGTTQTPTTLTFSNGTLTGSDNIQATNMSWRAGTMEGDGTTTVVGTLTFDVPTGGHSITMNRKLTVAGTATWTNNAGSATLSMNKNAAFTILPSATFEVGDGKRILAGSSGTGSGPRFDNQGVFRKVGTGTVTFGSGVSFSNAGTVELRSGTLDLGGGGTHTGSFVAFEGTTLEFGGGHTLASSSIINSMSAVVFSSGTNNVLGNYNVAGSTAVSGGTTNFSGQLQNVGTSATFSNGTANFTKPFPDTIESLLVNGGTVNFSTGTTLTPATLTLHSGTLTGSDTIEATNMSWRLGTMEGTGTTAVLGMLAFNMPTGGHSITMNRKLTVAGTTTWTHAGTATLSMNKNAVFTILPSATFDVNEGKNFTQSNSGTGSGPLFVNQGTFRKVGAGSFSVGSGVAISNTGTIELQSGTLSLGGGGTLNGTIIGRDGTTLDFSTGHTLASGSVISSTSAVRFTNGINNVQGSYNVAGSTTISGGAANFTGELVNVGGTVTVSGGSTTANFSSGETVRPATLVLDGGGTLSGTDAVEATNMTWITGSMLGGSAATTTVNNLNLNTPNTGNHTLTLGRTLNIVGTATWTNEGAAGLNLRKDGIINNQPGAIFEVATNKTFGTVNAGTGTPLFDNMGTFRVAAGTGSMTFGNGVPLRNSGEVQVRAGKLVLGTSGYTQLATGTLVIDKTSGAAPGTELHRVEVSGLATLAGTLRVIMADGYDPGFNITFTVLTYTTRNGQFSAIQGANLPAGKGFDSTYNSNNLTLTVVSATDEGPGTEVHSFIYLPMVNSNR